ncbi:hypothetical protein TNCV_2825611 [Trichonephila clavipes]|nr:hypothetical protein TNCV_2825611 [Trichonephila clavipes]
MFQEDFLKAWNRSATSAASTDAKERLTNLMTFLKAETEGEERINLAMAGFGLGVDENRQSFKGLKLSHSTFGITESDEAKMNNNMKEDTDYKYFKSTQTAHEFCELIVKALMKLQFYLNIQKKTEPHP